MIRGHEPGAQSFSGGRCRSDRACVADRGRGSRWARLRCRACLVRPERSAHGDNDAGAAAGRAAGVSGANCSRAEPARHLDVVAARRRGTAATRLQLLVHDAARCGRVRATIAEADHLTEVVVWYGQACEPAAADAATVQLRAAAVVARARGGVAALNRGGTRECDGRREAGIAGDKDRWSRSDVELVGVGDRLDAGD